MLPFKIASFIKDHPGTLPPNFEHLTSDAAEELWLKLAGKNGRPKGSTNEMLLWLRQHATPIADLNIEDMEVPLSEIFTRCEVDAGSPLYLHWDQPHDIDQFQRSELEKYFYDIWYPIADDIEIFDQTLDWVLFVRHYGGIDLWRAP